MQTSFARHYPLCKQRVAPLKRRTAPSVSLNENLNLMYSGELNSIELRKHFKFLIFFLDGVWGSWPLRPTRRPSQSPRTGPRRRAKSPSPPPQRRVLRYIRQGPEATISELCLPHNGADCQPSNKKNPKKKTISIWFVSSSSPVLPPGGESHLASVSRAATWRRISTGKKNSLKFDGK